jgi:hypothetical protein
MGKFEKEFANGAPADEPEGIDISSINIDDEYTV